PDLGTKLYIHDLLQINKLLLNNSHSNI
ncbi:virulence protein, partial [Shigella flexneri]|nr:virulence protein [Shigella flexneri]EFY4132536.1 virulence protein [Shigella flexneri]EFY5063162.1 virulence protein [Shigella flexneri]